MPERLIIGAARKTHRAIQAVRHAWRRSGPLAPPIFKGALFGLILLYVQTSGFAIWPVTLLILVGFVSYMQPVFRTFRFGVSLFLTIALSLLLTSRFVITLPIAMHAGFLGQLLFSSFFGFLFFILLGIKNSALARKREWYAVLFISLIYGISLLFFTSIPVGNTWQNVLLLAVFSYFLLKEYFVAQEHPKSRALTVITLSLTLLVGEMAWAISLLPVGFSKASSMLTLLVMMAAGITDRYVRGTLSARFLRVSALLIISLILVIFISMRWQI